jgi:hypothetical protein
MKIEISSLFSTELHAKSVNPMILNASILNPEKLLYNIKIC